MSVRTPKRAPRRSSSTTVSPSSFNVSPLTNGRVPQLPSEVVDLILEQYVLRHGIVPQFTVTGPRRAPMSHLSRLALVSKQWLSLVRRRMYYSTGYVSSWETCRLFLRTLRENEALRGLIVEVRIGQSYDGMVWRPVEKQERGGGRDDEAITETGPMSAKEFQELLRYCTRPRSVELLAPRYHFLHVKGGCKWTKELIRHGVLESEGLAGAKKVSINFDNLTSCQLSVVLAHTNPTLLMIEEWSASSKPLSQYSPMETTTGGRNIRCLSITGPRVPGPDLIHLFSLCPQLRSFQLTKGGWSGGWGASIRPEHFGAALDTVSATIEHISIEFPTTSYNIDYSGCLDSSLRKCTNLKSVNIEARALCSPNTILSLPKSLVHFRISGGTSSLPASTSQSQFWISSLSNPSFLPRLQDLRLDLLDADWDEMTAKAFVNTCAERENPIRVNGDGVGKFKWVEKNPEIPTNTRYTHKIAWADEDVMERFRRRCVTGTGEGLEEAALVGKGIGRFGSWAKTWWSEESSY